MSASTWSARWQQFRTLPRAIQWLALTTLAVVSFIIVNDYIWAIADTWNEKAARIERQVTDAGNIRTRELQAGSLTPVMLALGPVALPEKQATSSEALNRAVTQVLAKYRSVTDDRFDSKGAATMPQVLQRVMPAGTRIDKISSELRFDATVGDAISIIAELESLPEIEAIAAVRMVRQPSVKKVRVNLTVDAWVISEGKARTGAGNV